MSTKNVNSVWSLMGGGQGLDNKLLFNNSASSAYGTVTGEDCCMFKCFINVKSQFLENLQYFPLRNFHLMYYPKMQYRYNTLLSNFHSIICHVVAYWWLKTKESFKLVALKVVAVIYKRWSNTVAYMRWSLTRAKTLLHEKFA